MTTIRVPVLSGKHPSSEVATLGLDARKIKEPAKKMGKTCKIAPTTDVEEMFMLITKLQVRVMYNCQFIL